MAVRFVALFGALLLLTCTPATTTTTPPPRSAEPPRVTFTPATDAPDGFTFRLAEGEASLERAPAVPVAAAEKLNAAATDAVLARLGQLDAATASTFAFRERSVPAPRTGETIAEPFPPPAAAPAPEREAAAPLVLARFAPEGAVAIAPQVSVTFSQPMVPVTSHAVAASEVPVRITPAPQGGAYRWIGTKTLLFEADERLPMATSYRVEVPAGTTSAIGGKLATAKTWTFATPPPKLERQFPTHGPHPTDTLIALAFNQRVDATAVLATTQVRVGKTRYPVALVSDEVARADKRLTLFFAKGLDGRRVVLRTTERLPSSATVKVVVEPGTPSLEGPRKTDKPQTFTFRTYAPLEIKRQRCGWSFEECRPHWPFNIEFNNPLDADAFQQGWVKIAPVLANVRAAVSYQNLSVQGRTVARTTYQVTLSKDLRDEFGQTLGEDRTITFEVGPARPQLSAARQGFVVLDPAAKGTYSVFSVNFKKLKVQIYRVTPADWRRFNDAMRSHGWGGGGSKKMPGKRVLNETIRVQGEADQMVETRIDLAPALNDAGKGHAVVVVEHLDSPPPRTRRAVIRSWIQVTDIGLDAFVDDTELIAWTTALDNGAPLEGIELELRSSAATSGADGVATLTLEEVKDPKSAVLVARRGEDVAMLPEQVRWWGSGSAWVKQARIDSLRWHVFDDRHMYRPGEKVHVKGWVRRFGAGEAGDLGPLDDGTKELGFRVRDTRGETLRRGKVELNALGGFDFAFELPDEANLGWAGVELEARGSKLRATTHVHRFQVQEFRRPEFEVNVVASSGPHFVGEQGHATVTAAYFAGGGLANAPVAWTVSTSQGKFVPPNRDGFTFGTWTPWWGGARYQKGSHETFGGRTDALGKHHIALSFERATPPRPTTIKAEAKVTDVNRQRWSASATMLVHPASLYVGLATDGWFVERGEPIAVDAIVTDLDGVAVAGRSIAMEAVRLDWVYRDGDWQQKEDSPQPCQVDSSAEPVQCSFTTPDGGTYKVRATVTDDHGRPNQSEVTVWVTGGKVPPSREVAQESVTLIPDKKEYQPGDTAELMVQAPFAPAEGVLSLRRNGIQSQRRFRMESSSTVLKIPITERHLPSVVAQVDLVGAAARLDDDGNEVKQLPKRPAFAKGSLALAVPARTRTLTVSATPKVKELEPGGETTVTVAVTDAAGKALAGSEVAVVVVDEAILALSSYELADPIKSFYTNLGPGGRDHHLRENVLLADPEALVEMANAQPPGETAQAMSVESSGLGNGLMMSTHATRGRRSGAMEKRKGMGPSKPEPIRMRTDFNPLAVFSPENPTDAQGRATVEVKIPDNLTRYRVMVVAVAGARAFGKVESTLTARLPIMVRPSPPRFLNFGDRVELPVVIQNQTDGKLRVDVAMRASNLDITDGAGRRVEVAARDRVEVRFPASAVMAGEALVQVGATTGTWTDAATVRFPVWTPATTEAFAVYGELDEGAVRQPVRAPPGVVPQFGGLEITTSSTALQALTDAILYLVAYPYECAEQVSSRLLAVAALRDVLTAFDGEGMPGKDELAASMKRDIAKLRGLQNRDGGFGLWRSEGESWPYVTAHVTHALWRAKSKGYAVPKDTLERARDYLRDIESHLSAWPSERSRRIIVAYATHVLHLMGEKHPGKARRIIKEKGLPGLSLEAIGWVLPVLAADSGSSAQVAAIRKYLGNRVSETAAAANFVTEVHDGDYLTMRSRRRADAVILNAMIVTQPRHDLIPKLVRGLLAHRVRGRWGNTQENVFVLLALDRYFAKYEKQTPDFVARAWLGEQYAGEQKFEGRSTDRHHIDIPMRLVEGEQDLVLHKKGDGRLYYRIGMRYAPKSLVLEPADHGFTVERTYEPVDDPGDVTRGDDGTWKVKAGARVRVRLRMVVPARRYHVALVDPLPAGLEPLNPALAVTGDLPKDKAESSTARKRWWWWWRPWFEHQNMRDERVEAFASLVWDGVHSYTYVARATTPGTFVVPPTKAEEMYHPETFGRTGTDRLVVE